ncbi:hypothetical protein P378_03020 [Desulforamulus profundi]|uniref:Uncharacterized protein n=1 Tax=Desulforamulus profundi TaxID=1383067 RepID=A0A2C6MAV2_9FIRM|nr:hypothetical protein [Desulforamulus profundi]PHJ39507.1 hypothetical protein P378_03020 [Desulforamulus profundi]
MAKQEKITLLQFQKMFQTEEDCRTYLFKMLWPNEYKQNSLQTRFPFLAN